MAAPDRPPWRVAAVVVVVLAALGAAAGLATRDDDRPREVEENAAEAFLEAWARSRAATFRMEAEFVREGSTGARLGEHQVIVQRPPDRLTVRPDGATGLVDGRRIACSLTGTGAFACDEARARRTYDDDVARQLETLRSYVAGDAALYGVERVDECFLLDLARELPAPPLGTLATFCFDEEIGAPSLTRIERPEAIDETTTVSLTAEVTDEDLVPPVIPPED